MLANDFTYQQHVEYPSWVRKIGRTRRYQALNDQVSATQIMLTLDWKIRIKPIHRRCTFFKTMLFRGQGSITPRRSRYAGRGNGSWHAVVDWLRVLSCARQHPLCWGGRGRPVATGMASRALGLDPVTTNHRPELPHRTRLAAEGQQYAMGYNSCQSILFFNNSCCQTKQSILFTWVFLIYRY